MVARAFFPLVAAVSLAMLSCSTATGDPSGGGASNAVGSGLRIRQITDPSLPNHPNGQANPLPQVAVTGAVVLAIDNYDETSNGKSRGTIYIQDVGSQEPWSGISVFSPTFIPADLRLAPGDVLDFTGGYQENTHIGTAIFPQGQFLTQLAKPVGTLRYEYKSPTPRVIDVTDLDDYAKGSKWIGMVVTVNDVTLVEALGDEGLKKGSPATGRVTASLTKAKQSKVTNELIPLGNQPAGTKYKSITGIVTYFFSLHIAPRAPEDLVLCPSDGC